jgi:hypothetical protein
VKKANLISGIDPSGVYPVQMDDFSRFKEKLIMINTLKSLADDVDKNILKSIADKEGGVMTPKSLRRALDEIVDIALKRVTQ